MPRENRKRGKKHKKQHPASDQIQEEEVRFALQPESIEIEERGEPSWIVPVSKPEEDQNPEAPFGFVNLDVKAYFRTVDLQIRDWQEKQEDVTTEGDVDPNEQKRLFFMAALNEMHEKEKQLATDPDCSVVLERMSYSMDDFVRRVFVDSLSGSYEIIVRHRFASHVCQTLFTVAQDTISRETKGIMPAVPDSSDAGELRTLTQLELLPAFPSLIADPFGSHVVRSLLLLLSPNLVTSEETQSAVRSKKSAAWKAKQGQMKSVFEADTKGKAKETPLLSSTPEFRQMAKRFVEAIRNELGGNEVRAMAASKVACPGLKMLLEVEADQDMSNQPGSLMDRVMMGIITACQDESSPVVEESDYLGTLIRDPNSSHLLETIVSRCPGDAFDVLWETYFKGKLPRVAIHPVANFVLAKALERVSGLQLSQALTELATTWSKLIRTSRTGVLRAVVDRVSALNSNASSIADVVFSAFDITDASDKNSIVHCILTLLPLPEFTAAKATALPEKQPASHRGRQAQVVVDALEPKVQGSLLLQSLLRLPEQLNQFIVERILSLSIEERIRIAHNAAGSRVYDVLLESPTVSSKLKRQFVMDFIGHYHLLVDDKLGSRVGDRCWAFCDTYLKEKVARSLINNEQDLAASFYGKFFARNLNLYLLRRRPEEWKNLQSERKRETEQKQAPGPTAPRDPPAQHQQPSGERKRKQRPVDEIDALFDQKLGKKVKKAALEDKPLVDVPVRTKIGKEGARDKELEQVLGAIRIAPKNETHGRKKTK